MRVRSHALCWLTSIIFTCIYKCCQLLLRHHSTRQLSQLLASCVPGFKNSITAAIWIVLCVSVSNLGIYHAQTFDISNSLWMIFTILPRRIAFNFLKIMLDLVHSLAPIFFNQKVNSIDCVGVNFTPSISSFFVTNICSTVKNLPIPSIDHLDTYHITINFGNVPMNGGSVLTFRCEVVY